MASVAKVTERTMRSGREEERQMEPGNAEASIRNVDFILNEIGIYSWFLTRGPVLFALWWMTPAAGFKSRSGEVQLLGKTGSPRQWRQKWWEQDPLETESTADRSCWWPEGRGCRRRKSKRGSPVSGLSTWEMLIADSQDPRKSNYLGRWGGGSKSV